ncbi:hypothetical protein BUALT_Bualt14G0095200 [Buddleja alternifolia]|uniref:Cell division control protein 73 C-terminal domain-containing protein n=1 Tax=Buddleja alternifolia TaxID=168488 RepID=A0AAV6WI45_9LAMI|nr:hypothetical protein BUALT_Bualt14G0095200 [Buddleja alternifolia]
MDDPSLIDRSAKFEDAISETGGFMVNEKEFPVLVKVMWKAKGVDRSRSPKIISGFLIFNHLKILNNIVCKYYAIIKLVTRSTRASSLPKYIHKTSGSQTTQLGVNQNIVAQRFHLTPINYNSVARGGPAAFEHGNTSRIPEVHMSSRVDCIFMIQKARNLTPSRDVNWEEYNHNYVNVLIAFLQRFSIILRHKWAKEKPIRDREAMLVFKKRDFYSEDATKMRKIGEGVPIILVPSAFSTLITIYNVKDFLEDGVYIPTDVKLKQVKGGKPDCVTVQKKFSRDRVVTAYEVRDKPSALKSDDWDRVVAVFVLGKEWQFKDWPFKDHVEIFNKIVGFYMRFEDDSVESAKTVKQWNVKIISISKNKRHQDRAAALEVWEKLEEFMRSRSR